MQANFKWAIDKAEHLIFGMILFLFFAFSMQHSLILVASIGLYIGAIAVFFGGKKDVYRVYDSILVALVGIIFYFVATYVSISYAAITFVISVGVVKELLDLAYIKIHTPDIGDAVYTVIGGLIVLLFLL